MDFTIKKYEKLITSLKDNGYAFYTVKDWASTKPAEGIFLRHDVDRMPANSLVMARLENKYGIRSTYYFRILKCSFNERIMKEIASLGHEIGYHYEDLAMAGGDYEKAELLFKRNLDTMRKLYNIETIAMHGRPLSIYDNRDFWKKYRIEDYGLICETYLSIDYCDKYYFTDTGRTWSGGGSNYRDFVRSLRFEGVNTTDELIEFINTKRPGAMSILTHPERWNSGLAGWLHYFIRDTLVNFAKRILILLRRKK